MGLLDIFKKEVKKEFDDNVIISPCNSEMIPANKISDPVFGEEMMGKTIGFIPSDGEIVAPCNGTLEVLFPTGHAFAIRCNDGTGLLVHIGIDTVSLNGKGFKTFAKQGQSVVAGQKIVEMDIDVVKSAGLETTTMLIVTEPIEEREYDFLSFGQKKVKDVIL